jgi:hypothetical protein
VASQRIGAGLPGLGLGALGRVAEGVVGVDDEGGQQVVATREVAVDRRGDHAEVARHGAQRQGRRADFAELAAGRVLDLGDELGAGSFAGGEGRSHGRQSATDASGATFREQCS